MDNSERELEVELDTEELLEVPSCIESLSNSAQQLHKLADDISRYYIKMLLCYGYTSEPSKTSSRSVSPMNDKSQSQARQSNRRNLCSNKTQNNLEHLKKQFDNMATLESMDSILEYLPFLNDLSSFIERCFATCESTLKRLIYHLNKGANLSSSTHLTTSDEFQLSSDSKLYPIFVALMDLIYSLVSLDKVIRVHTNICDSLAEFRNICELVIEAQSSTSSAQVLDHDLSSIPSDRLSSLVVFVSNIQLTLCNETHSIFQLCLEHLERWNLIANKSQKGYESLSGHLEEFILFYSELVSLEIDHTTWTDQTKSQATRSQYLLHSNFTPTIRMTYASRTLFGLSSLFILYSRIFGKFERRVSQAVLRILQRPMTSNLVHLIGSNCYLLLDEFMKEHLAKTSLDLKALRQVRDRGEQVLKSDVGQLFDKFSVEVMKWSFKFKAEMLATKPEDEDIVVLSKRVHLFQQGVSIAEEVNQTVKSIMMTYLHHNQPMAKNNLINVLRLVHLIKAIETDLLQNRLGVYYCIFQIEHSIKLRWLSLMDAVRKRLLSSKHSERKLDTVSALLLTTNCSNFDYLTTNEGRTTMILCLSMLIPSLDIKELRDLNQLLDLLALDIYERLGFVADCGYLYWSYPTFGTYYNHAFEEHPCALDEIRYFHLALNDIQMLITTDLDCFLPDDFSWLIRKRDEFLARLGKELMEQFQTTYLDKICQELEIELRLQSHRDLQLDNHSPFKRHLYNFKQIFASSRCSSTIFSIFDRKISLRYYIEHYLNKTCYNLTSIAPHDWFTYDRMQNLARHRYDLKFVNSLLPTQSLDSGLDLIDIMRNLALFVSRYSYDMTNQLFIEKCSNRMSTSSASSTFSGGGISMLSSLAPNTTNQMLNVLQVKHIERSLQAHGYGLLSSSVNRTYQVLKRLISLFSKQLTDDRLRVILTKELQQFEQSDKLVSGKRRSGNQYSMTYEKANKMSKQFKAGAHNQVESQTSCADLDLLRQSITQIGNLLAFIRILKSGALNCASKSVEHLPNINDLSNLKLSKFSRVEARGNRCDTLNEACENFDRCLEDLDEHFSPKTNYFNIIIGLFKNILSDGPNTGLDATRRRVSPERNENQSTGDSGDESVVGTRDESHQVPSVITDDHQQKEKFRLTTNHRLDHLRLFFLLVPALTINYIDHIINCKERVSSRSSVARFGALISDDGFPMGLAFLLTVLEQAPNFARIEWFRQVSAKLDLQKDEVRQRIEDSRFEEPLKQTSNMTLGRLNRLSIEYVALDFTLNNALLFFKSCTLDPKSR